jgi:peptidoglycan/LPS O-acetylase OafA/YrhL
MASRVFGLDVLRSLAILQVLLGHGMSIYLGQAAKAPLEGFYGFLGVELFFVLSGFLVGGIALRAFEQGPSLPVLGDFLARRWLRTLPNYYLFLAVNAGLALWLAAPGFQARYLVFLQNLLWPMPPFFGESWSLAVEEIFYLVLPALLLATTARTRSPRTVLAALLAALAAFTALRLAYVAALQPPFHEVVRKTAGLRLDALMYGVVAAWLARYARGVFLARPRLCLAIGAAAVVVAVRMVVVTAPQSPLAASLAVCGVSLGAALTLPFLSTWRTAWGPARAGFEVVSRLSYALYLCHLPTSAVLLRLGLPRGMTGLVVWLAVSGLVAAAVHYGFERPFLTLRDRLPHPRRGTTTAPESAPAQVRP